MSVYLKDVKVFCSVEAYRNAFLSGHAGLFASPYTNTAAMGFDAPELERHIVSAFREGRCLCFDKLNLDIVQQEARRGGDAIKAGEITQPYDEWVAMADWEEHGRMSCFFVSGSADYFLVAEIFGFYRDGPHPHVMVGDVAQCRGERARVPLPQDIAPDEFKGREAAAMRARAMLDPVAAFLSLLTNASVKVEHVAAPHRLNIARAKAGKFAIPPHTKVNANAYVTWLRREARGEGRKLGGTHASPVAHWRRSHTRILASGRVAPVKSSHVNWRDTEAVRRLFYRVGEPV